MNDFFGGKKLTSITRYILKRSFCPQKGHYKARNRLFFDRLSLNFSKIARSDPAPDYYIFEILAGCPELMEGIISGLKIFEKQYPSWFKTFLGNMEGCFTDVTSDGINMISSQRPISAFPELTGDQFRQYTLGKFRELIDEIKK